MKIDKKKVEIEAQSVQKWIAELLKEHDITKELETIRLTRVAIKLFSFTLGQYEQSLLEQQE